MAIFGDGAFKEIIKVKWCPDRISQGSYKKRHQRTLFVFLSLCFSLSLCAEERFHKHIVRWRPWASLMAQWVKNLLAMHKTQETWVWSLRGEDPWRRKMATHSSILAWKNPIDRAWHLQSVGVTKSHTQLSNWCMHSRWRPFTSHEEGSHQKINLQKPWSWISSCHNTDKTNVYYLSSQSVIVIFCYENMSRLTYLVISNHLQNLYSDIGFFTCIL